MLARLAAPLASHIQSISSVDKTTEVYILWIKSTKFDCHGNFRRRIEAWISDRSFTTIPENLAKLAPVDFEAIGLTKNRRNNK